MTRIKMDWFDPDQQGRDTYEFQSDDRSVAESIVKIAEVNDDGQRPAFITYWDDEE